MPKQEMPNQVRHDKKNPPLSVIFAGSGDFGAAILESLARDKNIRIPFIITGQDKASGRGLKVKESAIKQIGLKNKLIVHQPGSLPELKQKIIQEKPDLLLVVAYGEIIKKELLEIPRLGAFNIHPSLLPRYRGASPVAETLLNGDAETGITWILMNEKMDEGDIIAQRLIPVAPDDTALTLSKKLSELASRETVRVLTDFSKTGQCISQDPGKASWCRKISKKDGLIDFSRETAEQIERKVRAYHPWPGCFFTLDGKRIKIILADISEQKISPRSIVVLEGNIAAIGTAKGSLLLLRVQPESKREMDVWEFLRGLKKIPEKVG